MKTSIYSRHLFIFLLCISRLSTAQFEAPVEHIETRIESRIERQELERKIEQENKKELQERQERDYAQKNQFESHSLQPKDRQEAGDLSQKLSTARTSGPSVHVSGQAPVRNQEDSLPVQHIAESQKPITVKNQSLADWQQAWNSFTYQGRLGGYLGGQKGELYTLPVEARAAKILDFIKEIPSGFTTNPEAGIKALGSLLSEAENALKGSQREAAQYAQIAEAVTERLVATIQKGDFGKNPAQALEELAPESLRNTVSYYFKNSEQLFEIVETAAAEKALNIVEKVLVADGPQGVAQLTQLIDRLHSLTYDKAKTLQQQTARVVAQKISEVLAQQKLPEDPKAAINELVKTYLFLQNKNYLTPEQWESVRQNFMNRIQDISNISVNAVASIDQLIILLKKSSFKNTQDIQGIINTISALLLNDIRPTNNGTFALTSDPDEVVQHYKNQLKTLKDFLSITQNPKYSNYFNARNLPLQGRNLQATKRMLRLINFLEQQQRTMSKNKQGASTSVINRLERFLGFSKSPLNIAERDPKFWQEYQEIKTKRLFENPALTALPEDMVAAGLQELPALERAAQTGALSAENKQLLNELTKIRNIAVDPVFKDQIPNAQEFIEQFDKITARLNIKAVESINRIDLEAQELIKKAQTERNTELSTLQETLEPLLKELEIIASSAGFTSQERLIAVQSQLEAWQNVSRVATQIPQALTASATVQELQQAYSTLVTATVSITQAFDYRDQNLFIARLETMEQQKNALSLITESLEQKITVDGQEYTLSQLDNYLQSWITNLTQPNAAVIKALQESGFITLQTSSTPDVVRFELTQRGTYLTALALETQAINGRVQQLSNYIEQHQDKYQAQGPAWQQASETSAAARAAKLATRLNLPELILDDQVAALQTLYNEAQIDPRRKVINDALASGEKQNVSRTIINIELLEDVQEIISTLNQKNNGKSVSPALEIFTEYQLRQARLPESQKTGKTSALSEAIMRLNATGDISTAVQITAAQLRQEITSLAGQVGSVMGDAFSYTALQLQKTLMSARQVGSLVIKIASLPASLWAYFTVKQAVANGASPLAAYMVPGIGTLADALGLAAGAATGVSLWLLASQAEPSPAALAELNKELESRGIAPIDTKGNGSLKEKAQKWATQFLQTDFQNALDAARAQQKIVEEKIAIFNKQRATLYASLEIPVTASFTEFNQAIERKFQDTQNGGSIIGKAAQALAKRRIRNQLELVVQSAQRMAQAHQAEMTNWANVALKGAVNSAAQNTSVLAETVAKITGSLGDLWRTLSGKTAAAGQETAKASFDPVYTALQSFYEQQQADLSALITAVEAQANQIPATGSVRPAQTVQVIQDALTGRIEATRNEYLNGIQAFLKEEPYSPVFNLT